MDRLISVLKKIFVLYVSIMLIIDFLIAAKHIEKFNGYYELNFLIFIVATLYIIYAMIVGVRSFFINKN